MHSALFLSLETNKISKSGPVWLPFPLRVYVWKYCIQSPSKNSKRPAASLRATAHTLHHIQTWLLRHSMWCLNTNFTLLIRLSWDQRHLSGLFCFIDVRRAKCFHRQWQKQACWEAQRRGDEGCENMECCVSGGVALCRFTPVESSERWFNHHSDTLIHTLVCVDTH